MLFWRRPPPPPPPPPFKQSINGVVVMAFSVHRYAGECGGEGGEDELRQKKKKKKS